MNNANIPTILILFGATGDLVAKKIIPALFHLFSKHALPAKLQVIGFSRQELSEEEFRSYVESIVHKRVKIPFDEKTLKEFSSLFSYKRGAFERAPHYAALARAVEKVDAAWGVCSNKLFYLAVPPHLYEGIFKRLFTSGLTKPCSAEEGWTRILVEKPFGKDLRTSQKLDILLGKLFKEIQIYRIDHYLAKEMLQNILTFRFSNNLFEKNWGSGLIERIEIRVLEQIGVEDRGTFYDDVGALRDVGQNHLLQMLALVAMERPVNFSVDAIRANRAEILTHLRMIAPREMPASTFRAQYEGYRTIPGVKADSRTETYFKVAAFLDDNRWSGVPIWMESGKRMGEARKEIVIVFRHPSPCLCPPSGEHYQNKIVIQLEPEETIQIDFWSKKPGLAMDMEKRSLNFHLRQAEGRAQYAEEYEKLLLDCIAGDQTLFVSTVEVQSMWKYIDPILRAWRANKVPLVFYKPDNKDVLLAAQKALSLDSQEPAQKEIGIAGLGKMGANIARRLLQKNWRVVGYNKSRRATDALLNEGIAGTYDLQEFVSRLASPRLIWLMVPAGEAVDEVIASILPLLKRGDCVIDGGNSFYKDSLRRGRLLKKHGIDFMDVGVSGGPAGALQGSALMIGGNKKIFEKWEALFADLATENGYAYVGPAGAGHFVKMVHNGIEYGMMQSIAEGFAILKHANYKLNLERIASVYNHGSVVESRLIGWLQEALHMYGEALKDVSGSVARTGEADWTLRTAREEKLKARVIEEAVKFRAASEKKPSYAGKILSALRNRFGGHAVTF